jgi:predicted NUDIX family NTP pyrophosphohydrolase
MRKTPTSRNRKSAGLLLFRRGKGGVWEVLLAHPGGPFWAKKDDGVWSIPKGEVDNEEDAFAAARREFAEETGFTPEGSFLDLGEIKQRGGKLVHVWAVESDFDPHQFISNTFEMEWPIKSGRIASFPEVDCASWFDIATARCKILKGQLGFIDRMIDVLKQRAPRAANEESTGTVDG